jgi:hydrogenase expression/formation protein HypE
MSVLGARGELGFEADIRSDVAPLNHLIAAVLEDESMRSAVHVLRDPTRGGVATTLNEIACQSHQCILIDEKAVPVRSAVSSVCELLGFDPLYVANEGKLIAIVAKEMAGQVLKKIRAAKYGEEAVILGEVKASPVDRVLMRTSIGSTRVVDMLAGEMLPRIC